jgi:peptidyl-tRNA hydrolase, PTH1 family
MYYIVGLGNPGTQYEGTRHNVGFDALSHVARVHQCASWHTSKSPHAARCACTISGQEVLLIQPQTFMNESGGAVAKIVPKDALKQLVVVYDDVHLPLGSIKVSFDRGAGGHNGVASIIKALGTQAFTRIRIGVAQKTFFTGKVKIHTGEKLSQFVLGKFSGREQAELAVVLSTVSDAIKTIVTEGHDAAMNRYNS